MANIQNLTPFTKENASKMGRKGGIVSGRKRRKKARLRKYLYAYIELSDYIDDMNDVEYKSFIRDYTEEEQKRIGFLFRNSKK